MELTDEETKLIIAATEAAQKVPLNALGNVNDDHKVGAAVLTSASRIMTGINLSHFAGGSCAESVALANAASAGVASSRIASLRNVNANAESVVLCVAVLWDGKVAKVLNPCGRCRQVLMDYWPECGVLVDVGRGEVRRKASRELLPWPCQIYEEKEDVEV